MSPSTGSYTPPEETPWTIDELMRKRALEHPDVPLVAYPTAGIEYVEYTASQLDIFAFRIAQNYSKCISRRKSSAEKIKVVAILASSTIDYLLSTLALTKMGFTVLFLSTRLSEQAYLSLLTTTGCCDIVADSAMRKTAVSLLPQLPRLRVHDFITADVYSQALPIDESNTAMDSEYDPAVESANVCWVIHSSGSTGLPKPIYQTHAAALRNYANNFNMKGYITLPLYHAHGISSVFRGIHSLQLIHMYNASLPLTAPTLIDTMKKHAFEVFYGVPYALKLLGESQQGIDVLKKLKLVMFGGSSCPKDLGDRLVKNGVPLISHYGTTETGQLMTSFRERDDLEWDYLRVSKALAPFVRWEEQGPGIFELVVLPGWPSKVATNRDDGSYATKDLFSQHPGRPELFRWTGRLDDTLVLLNGEKANPIPLEHAIREHPLVAEAVVFGSNKPQLGAFVVPKPGFDGGDDKVLLQRIAPAIEAANRAAPGYSQIASEMVRVLPVGTIYPRTDKDTVIRAAFYKQFQVEIDRIYAELTAQSCDAREMDEAELQDFLKSLLLPGLKLPEPEILTVDTDFFTLGLDSLQALRIHSRILKNVNIGNNTLGQNIVFEYPTIKSLSQQLLSLRSGNEVIAQRAEDRMLALIEKYRTFRPHMPGSSDSAAAVVLTGATGSLGAHVLSKLLLDANIEKVYCLVRARDAQSAQARVVTSLVRRAVYHDLQACHRAKVVALASDLSKPDLGLEHGILQDIQASAIHVIHLAWAVNFNMGVESFEKHHIAGTHNLIQLCLDSRRRTPAQFHFGSSVSSVAASKDAVRESIETNMQCAQGMGYAQSKLVTERICDLATQSTTVQANVYRIGQIVGDTRHGIWNATEAIPLMIQSAVTVGALPELDEYATWLPVDTVANSILDLVHTSPFEDSPSSTVYHVISPSAFHWTRDLLPALDSAGLHYERVNQREWVRRLEASDTDPVANPPYKLLNFFKSKYDKDEPRRSLYYSTDRTCRLSRSLHAAPPLSAQQVSKFVKYWQKECWASGQAKKSTVIVIAGPCGSGKSTVANALSRHFDFPWVEADELHSAEAIAKMSKGKALNDEDRSFWLEKTKRKYVAAAVDRRGVVVSCSALKAAYRDHLRDLPSDVNIMFWMLEAPKDALQERLDKRQGHYMKKGMLDSQMLVLEPPRADEADVVAVDVSGSKEYVVSLVTSLMTELLDT